MSGGRLQGKHKHKPKPKPKKPHQQDLDPISVGGMGNALIIKNSRMGADSDGSGDFSDPVYHKPSTAFRPGGEPLDGTEIPFIVIWTPSHHKPDHGIQLGDFGVIIIGDKPIGFIVGDTGHSLGGEGSIGLIKSMGGNPNGGNNELINPPPLIVFPGSGASFGGNYHDPGAVQAQAQALYDNWLKNPQLGMFN